MDKKSNESVKELYEAGAHFGYSRTRRHPSTASFVYGSKNSIDILDLTKTDVALTRAQEFIKEIAGKGGKVLFVGTKNEARSATSEAASKIEQPFISVRWIGGTLTNFTQIRTRVNRLEGLMEQREKGELEKYTKKERLDFDREIEKLDQFFGGLRVLKDLPAALVVVDPKAENTAIREAKRKQIPVIAIAGTHANFDEIDYVIPANDSNRKSIKYLLDKLADAYAKNVNTASAQSEATEKANNA